MLEPKRAFHATLCSVAQPPITTYRNTQGERAPHRAQATSPENWGSWGGPNITCLDPNTPPPTHRRIIYKTCTTITSHEFYIVHAYST